MGMDNTDSCSKFAIKETAEIDPLQLICTTTTATDCDERLYFILQQPPFHRGSQQAVHQPRGDPFETCTTPQCQREQVWGLPRSSSLSA